MRTLLVCQGLGVPAHQLSLVVELHVDRGRRLREILGIRVVVCGVRLQSLDLGRGRLHLVVPRLACVPSLSLNLSRLHAVIDAGLYSLTCLRRQLADNRVDVTSHRLHCGLVIIHCIAAHLCEIAGLWIVEMRVDRTHHLALGIVAFGLDDTGALNV